MTLTLKPTVVGANLHAIYANTQQIWNFSAKIILTDQKTTLIIVLSTIPLYLVLWTAFGIAPSLHCNQDVPIEEVVRDLYYLMLFELEITSTNLLAAGKHSSRRHRFSNTDLAECQPAR